MYYMLAWILVVAHIALSWARAIRRGMKARWENQNKKGLEQPRQRPPVSVLVPAWCEKGTVEACIRSLRAVEYPHWEALILAGGSDGTYEAALQTASGDGRLQVLKRGPEPKNAALMQGVRAARYDILVILDADSQVEPDWLDALAEPLEAGAAASFGMHFPARETWISLQEHMQIYSSYYIHDNKLAQGCSSFAITRCALERIGPLPMDAYSWEDWDIDIRLMEAGEIIDFAPQARLLSDRPATLRGYWGTTLRSFRSHFAGLWHHRAYFLKRPLFALYEIFFLGYGSLLAFAAGIAIIIIVARPSQSATIAKTVFLIAVWLLGRRSSLGGELWAYTGSKHWLRWAWAPAAMLPVQLLAAFVATLSVWKQPSFDYKGPREVSVGGDYGYAERHSQ